MDPIDGAVVRPWSRLRPALGVGIAVVVLGYFGSQIGPPTGGTGLVVDTAGAGEPWPVATEIVRQSSPHDFQIVVNTIVCTNVEWTWDGPGSTGTASSERCATSHILSPPVSERLRNGARYVVSAEFVDDNGATAVFDTVVTTATPSD